MAFGVYELQPKRVASQHVDLPGYLSLIPQLLVYWLLSLLIRFLFYDLLAIGDRSHAFIPTIS